MTTESRRDDGEADGGLRASSDIILNKEFVARKGTSVQRRKTQKDIRYGGGPPFRLNYDLHLTSTEDGGKSKRLKSTRNFVWTLFFLDSTPRRADGNR